MSDQQAQELDAALVEIVAQAIFQDDLKDEGGGTWESHDDGEKEAYRSNARAALLAARSVQVERPDEGLAIAYAALDRIAHARRDFAAASRLEGTAPILEAVERYARNCLDESKRLAAARLPADEGDEALRLVMLCKLCRSGAGGECHMPGCALYLNRAPDLPVAARLPERPDEGIAEAMVEAAAKALEVVAERWGFVGPSWREVARSAVGDALAARPVSSEENT